MFPEIPPSLEEFTCNFLVILVTLKSSSSSSRQRQAGDYARLVSECLLVTVSRHKDARDKGAKGREKLRKKIQFERIERRGRRSDGKNNEQFKNKRMFMF